MVIETRKEIDLRRFKFVLRMLLCPVDSVLILFVVADWRSKRWRCKTPGCTPARVTIVLHDGPQTGRFWSKKVKTRSTSLGRYWPSRTRRTSAGSLDLLRSGSVSISRSHSKILATNPAVGRVNVVINIIIRSRLHCRLCKTGWVQLIWDGLSQLDDLTCALVN